MAEPVAPPRGSKLQRGFLVIACVVSLVLTERIMTSGSFTDLMSIATAGTAPMVAGLIVSLGAIVVAVLAIIGARNWQRLGLAWGLLAAGSGLVFLLNDHDSGLAIALIGALTVLVVLPTSRIGRR